MKQLSITLMLFLLAVAPAFSQMQSFKYQAVARDALGAKMANQNIGIRMSILFGNVSGPSVYVETHNITTNDFGLLDLRIGEGIPVSGVFSAIDWSAGEYFVKIDIDPTGGTTYNELGTTQLLAVPFAKYAERAGFPAGMIVPFAGDTNKIPQGWILCDGREISRTAYSDLLDAIGIAWGPGNGVSTFNVPDLRGAFLRGVDLGAGRDPDAASRYALHPTGNSGDNVASYQNEATTKPNDLSLSTEGNHAHSGTTGSTGAHTHTGTTSSSGAHKHKIAYANSTTGTVAGDLSGTEALARYGNQGLPGKNLTNDNHEYDLQGVASVTPNVGDSSESGAHTHTFTTSSTGAHTHTFTTSTTGAHTHTVTGWDNETRPINANVNYIIKY